MENNDRHASLESPLATVSSDHVSIPAWLLRKVVRRWTGHEVVLSSDECQAARDWIDQVSTERPELVVEPPVMPAEIADSLCGCLLSELYVLVDGRQQND